MRRTRMVWSLAPLLLSALSGAVEPLRREAVPDPLKAWIPWVLTSDDSEQASRCAFLHGTHQWICAWPARLSLVLDDKGGRFSQQWRVQRDLPVALPGDAKRWPLDVRVDGQPAVVTASGESPTVQLKAGDHTLTGAFLWDSLPESLRVPPDTGLVELTVRGVRLPLPNRDGEGLLYLSKQATSEEQENLDISVQRQVADEIPLVLTTRIILRVSGKAREVLLGRSLPAGFIPLSLESPLPARLEDQGRLRVQVRPGEWTLTLTARHPGPVGQLSRPEPDGPWTTGEEIWAFQPHPELRLVTLEGVPSIDPQQTRLPDAWKRLATYPMQVKDTLKLLEQRRGDSDPGPDQLSLERDLWLDFDGQGYTAKDALTGKMNRSARLTMSPGVELGRVEIAGRDQFITQLDHGGTGVEVRDAVLQASADSRIAGRSDIPAVGWDHDFRSVSATLHLPPGWLLFHASGADEVPTTWIRRWTLMDLFVLLLTALAMGRLFGPLWGGVALVTLTLSLQESDAPQWLWLALLAGEALVRALPAGRIQGLFRFYRLAVSAVLALTCVFFLIQNLRTHLFPALERPYEQVGFMASASATKNAPAAPPASVSSPVPEPEVADAEGIPPEEKPQKEELPTRAKHAWKGGAVSGKYQSFGASTDATQANRLIAQDVDRSVSVQTGPGLPQWSWESVPMRWSGPVERSQRLHLYYLSPAVNLFLALLRLLLISALVVRLLPLSRDRWTRWLGRPPRAAGAALAMALALGLSPSAARAQLPSNELLEQLKQRLTVPPVCHPSCATSGRLLLEATPAALTLRMEIDSAAVTAVPLPGQKDQWLPETVAVDGKPAAGLSRSSDGVLWLPLTPGTHQIVLQGALPRWESVQLALPLRPHWVQAKLSGWTLAGLHEDGLADADLQLTRVRGSTGEKESALQSTRLPPFVHVRRTLALALDWEVTTEVVRASPGGSAIVLEVPLLPGESVTSADVRVANGKALVNLGAQSSGLSWHSTLSRASAIRLTAPAETGWVEQWRLDVSPLWHVTLTGIPPVHRQDASGAQVPEFHPWPGESVAVAVQRPEGIAGQTLTLDQSERVVRPGLRATDGLLTLSLRSSRGGQHGVLLPEGAELQSVSLNGKEQPIRQEGRQVTLPVAPGPQTASLSWREPTGMGLLFRTSSVDVGAPTVNANTQVDVPSDRWILYAGGPRLGPSVLFWSLMLILLVVSGGLSRSTLTPMRLHEWLLLSLGLSQVPVYAAALVAGWLLFLGWRGQDTPLSRLLFNGRQLALLAWTVAALAILAVAVEQGLLGLPDMQVGGNGSTSSCLRWFQDRTGPGLSSAWVLTVPLFIYRLAMLAWALWLARALLRWLRWGWGCFNSGGLWKPRPPKAIPVVPPTHPSSG